MWLLLRCDDYQLRQWICDTNGLYGLHLLNREKRNYGRYEALEDAAYR